jgi:repressor LexA
MQPYYRRRFGFRRSDFPNLETSHGEHPLKRHGGMGIANVTMKKLYTHKQGQCLAFIYHYTRIHRRAPAEAEMQEYFRVSPPSVHQMVLTLEARGLIERTPGQARSVRLLIPPEQPQSFDNVRLGPPSK